MSNKLHPEESGEFAGLWVRTAEVLRANGITTRAQLAALAGPHPGADGISPFWRIKGCGKKLAAEIVAWLRRTSAERVMRDFA